jgi:hypothetical protein
MRHSIDMYDTGHYNSYSRRNEGWLITSCIGGGILALVGFIMLMIGLFDPIAPIGVAYAGLIMFGLGAGNGAMFLSHRNFGLDQPATAANDSLYLLPKDVRKEYKINRAEIKAIGHSDAQALVDTIDDYRRNNGTASGLSRLHNSLTEYNKVYKEFEPSDR